MVTIKKLQPETVISSTEVNGKVFGYKTGKKVSWAVVNESGEVLKSNGQYEIYPRKDTAQMVAEHYNGKQVA